MVRGHAGRTHRWYAAVLVLCAAALCAAALAQPAYADGGMRDKDIALPSYVAAPSDYGVDAASTLALDDDASEPEARWEAGGASGEGTFSECYAQMLTSDSGTITLLRDVSYAGSMMLFEDQSLVLDLNGCTLEAVSGDYALVLLDNAHATVCDSAGGGVFRFSSDDSEGYLVYLYSGSPSFALEGGTLSTGLGRTVMSSCGAVSIAGGTVTSASDCTVGVWAGTLNVSGGCIANTGSYEAVYLHPLYGASAFVSGGTFEAAAYPAVTVKGTSTLNLSGSPTLTGTMPGSNEPCGLATSGTVIANDGADPATYYRGDPLMFAVFDFDSVETGTALVEGLDKANANRFRLVGSEDGEVAFDGFQLLLTDSDDPRIIALNDLASAVDAPADDLFDLRSVVAQAAALAGEPALAPQRYLLTDAQQAELAEREGAVESIDAFEEAMDALPAADDAGARAALEAAQTALASIPEAYRGATFVPAAQTEALAAYEKAVQEAEKPAPVPDPEPAPDPDPTPDPEPAPDPTPDPAPDAKPLPDPEPSSQPDPAPQKLAATGDPIGATSALACAALAAAGIAIVLVRRLRARR